MEDINTRTEKVRRFIAVEKNKEINRTWNDTLKGLDESKRRLEEELKKRAIPFALVGTTYRVTQAHPFPGRWSRLPAEGSGVCQVLRRPVVGARHHKM